MKMKHKIRSIQNTRVSLRQRMETVGDVLKKERKRQEKTFDSISLDTKIDKKKLKALEENNFQLFDSPVNAKGFMRIYAQYLNLNPEKILAIYRRDFGEKKERHKIDEVKEKEDEKRSFPWKYASLLIPAIILIATLMYLYSQFASFQNPPDLEILEPENNAVVKEESVNIKGRTQDDALIKISGAKIPVDENGDFTTNISLKEGSNTITVRATSTRNPSRESIEVINITYEREEIEEEEEEEKLEKIDLSVTVENNPTWVEIIVDDQLITAQVLQVGYEESFEAQRNVQVNTSILQNAKVEINGEQRGLSSETFSIRCEILDNELECE